MRRIKRTHTIHIKPEDLQFNNDTEKEKQILNKLEQEVNTAIYEFYKKKFSMESPSQISQLASCAKKIVTDIKIEDLADKESFMAKFSNENKTLKDIKGEKCDDVEKQCDIQNQNLEINIEPIVIVKQAETRDNKQGLEMINHTENKKKVEDLILIEQSQNQDPPLKQQPSLESKSQNTRNIVVGKTVTKIVKSYVDVINCKGISQLNCSGLIKERSNDFISILNFFEKREI